LLHSSPHIAKTHWSRTRIILRTKAAQKRIHVATHVRFPLAFRQLPVVLLQRLGMLPSLHVVTERVPARGRAAAAHHQTQERNHVLPLVPLKKQKASSHQKVVIHVGIEERKEVLSGTLYVSRRAASAQQQARSSIITSLPSCLWKKMGESRWVQGYRVEKQGRLSAAVLLLPSSIERKKNRVPIGLRI
jgi:hypothetical protein